jgi:hypothetical protein
VRHGGGLRIIPSRRSRRVGVSLDLSFSQRIGAGGILHLFHSFLCLPLCNTFLSFPKISTAEGSFGFFFFLAISLHHCLTSACASDCTPVEFNLLFPSLLCFTPFWLLASTLLSRFSLADILCQCLFRFLHSLYTLSSSKHVYVSLRNSTPRMQHMS